MSIFSSDDLAEMNRLTTSGNATAATALIQNVLARSCPAGGGYEAPRRWQEARLDPVGESPVPESVRVLNPDVRAPFRTPYPSRDAATDGSTAAPIDVDSFTASPTSRQTRADDTAPTASRFIDGVFPGIERTLQYKLFIPSRPSDTPAPLLVMLHGCTQDAEDFATGTAMNAVAEAAGCHVLYPVQTAQANMNRCWNWFEPAHQQREHGEPALISALTRRIIEDYPIDAGKVFIAGLSAGGAMALILAEEYPELFAAVGVHSGLPTGVASSIPQALAAMRSGGTGTTSGPATGLPGGLAQAMPFRGFSPVNGEPAGTGKPHGSPVPTIVFHGARDHTVSPANADRIVNDWLVRNSHDQTRQKWTQSSTTGTTSTGHGYTVSRYRRGSNGEDIGCEQWTLARTAHQWSGGNAAGSHTDANGPDASREMIRFFLSCTSH